MPGIQSTTPQEVAEARLAVYRFLRAVLNKPTPEQHAWLRLAECRHALELVCEQFALPCPTEEPVPEAYEDYESRYLACFEVGLPAPPVALQSSTFNHREPVPAVIHEHVLFYKRFGLQRLADDIEPADHLLNELAFLIHLDELLLTEKVEAQSLRLARRDFLKRQVTRWVAGAAAEANDKHLPAIYCTLLALLAKAVQQDLELTSDAVNHSDRGDTMSRSHLVSRTDFERVLADQQQLIDLANQLEYQLYRLGELPLDERVTDCQQAGGMLLGLLRDVLFRQDQQVLPLLESLIDHPSEEDPFAARG